MSLLVRKIAISKWRQTDIEGGKSPSADAITGCLRTSGNTLSLWAIESEKELEDAVVAIAATQTDKLETFDITAIEQELIENSGLSVISSAGKTPYQDFVTKHRDICQLDYESLGKVASLIVESIRNNRNQRFTKARLVNLVSEAVKAGKIQIETLEPKMQEQLQRHMKT